MVGNFSSIQVVTVLSLAAGQKLLKSRVAVRHDLQLGPPTEFVSNAVNGHFLHPKPPNPERFRPVSSYISNMISIEARY